MTRTTPQTPRPRRADARHVFRTTLGLLASALRFLCLLLRPQARLAARCLVVEKELALYVERKVKPRRFDDAGRITLALLSTFADVKEVLVAVKPSALVRWKRRLWALYWRWKSRPRGRPRIPKDVQALIAHMSRDNPTWGEERIHSELLLKLGIGYCPRAIQRYIHKDPGRGPGRHVSRERWSTFVRGHIDAILACDFFTEVTLGFTSFYVFVVMELGTRRILHVNVTRHPTADWTTQQLRDAIPAEHPYRFLIHDRDKIFSLALDAAVSHMGIRVLKTPRPQRPTPSANASSGPSAASALISSSS